ncbi:hypothetical protein EZS27_024174 [termite gut metagenome]|uniref:Uncharacterized protein n=1 Tax=termite gut metagenome TaxID=433724 RepID=A0A5J4QYW1_9ZZZZ
MKVEELCFKLFKNHLTFYFEFIAKIRIDRENINIIMYICKGYVVSYEGRFKFKLRQIRTKIV